MSERRCSTALTAEQNRTEIARKIREAEAAVERARQIDTERAERAKREAERSKLEDEEFAKQTDRERRVIRTIYATAALMAVALTGVLAYFIGSIYGLIFLFVFVAVVYLA